MANIWEVEIDGNTYEIEGGDTPPSEQEARQAISGYTEPKELSKFGRFGMNLLGGMEQAGRTLPLTGQFHQLEDIQKGQRETIQDYLYNRALGGRFPVARGITAEALNYITPSNIIAGGTLPYLAGRLATKGATIPTTRRFMQRQLPTFTSKVLEKTPIEPKFKTIKGMEVDITKPLPKEVSNLAKFNVDYISQNIFPRAQQFISKNIQEFTPGIEEFAKTTLKLPQRAIQTIKSKGISSINAIRNTYNDSVYPIMQKITEGIENKRLQADNFYGKIVNDFKGTINASSFRVKLGSILRKKGWIDQTGKPTTRFGSKLDPVLDDLTRLHQELRTIQRLPKKAGGKIESIKGLKISKEDFMTYRDLLGRMLKERPTDIYIMELRNALYNSAEQSGMKGIIKARDLERVANNVEQDLARKGLINEKKLSNYNKLSEQELWDLKELQMYIQEPFIDDLSSITAGRELDKLIRVTQDIPGQQEGLLNRLQNATSPKNFTQIKKDLAPLLGKYTEEIFKDIAQHRTITGLKTFGKYGLGLGLGYRMIGRPILNAITGGGGGRGY